MKRGSWSFNPAWLGALALVNLHVILNPRGSKIPPAPPSKTHFILSLMLAFVPKIVSGTVAPSCDVSASGASKWFRSKRVQ